MLEIQDKPDSLIVCGLLALSVCLSAPQPAFAASQIEIELDRSPEALVELVHQGIILFPKAQPHAIEARLDSPRINFRGLPVAVREITAQASLSSVQTAVEGGLLQVNAQLSQPVFRIREVEVNGVISESLGSVRLNVRVQGTCRAIRMSNKQSWQLRGAFRLGIGQGGIVHAGISDFSAFASSSRSEGADRTPSAGHQDWDVEMSCDGPVGFADEVRQRLIEAAGLETSNESLNRWIPNQIQTRLNESLRTGPIRFGPVRTADADSARRILPLCLQLEGKEVNDCASESTSVSDDGRGSGLELKRVPRLEIGWKRVLIRTPLSLIEEVVARSDLKKKVVSRKGSEISGFQRLMRSRWMQFFLWPDLMQFPKHTDFKWVAQINSYLERPIQLSCTAEGTLKFRTYAHAWLQATSTIVRFDSWIEGSLGQTASVEPLDLKFEFDPSELARRRVNQSIALELIEPRLRDELQAVLNSTLPSEFKVLGCR